MARNAPTERAMNALRQLQDRVADLAAEGQAGSIGYLDRVMVAPCHNGIAVAYNGECYGEAWELFLSTISEQQIADHLVSIEVSGPDEGANGTRDWSFDALIESNVQFPALVNFYVQPTEPQHHNGTVMTRSGAMLEEAGVIANIVGRMPLLEELTVSTYPSAEFFELDLNNLALLTIGCGYSPGAVIKQLSKTSKLRNLRLLDFADSEQPFLEYENGDNDRESVVFEDYKDLFASSLFDHVGVFRLRNAILSEAEFLELQSRRPGLQFLAILSGRGTYVSHWQGQHFPYKHLILDKARWFGK